MATKTAVKRVNLSVPIEMLKIIMIMAARDGVSVTTKTMQLVEDGIEMDEDMLLAQIAEERSAEIESGEVEPIEYDEFCKMVEVDRLREEQQ